MNTEVTKLEREDIFQIVDNIDGALGVIRKEKRSEHTALDIYFESLLATLRRELLKRPGAMHNDVTVAGR